MKKIYGILCVLFCFFWAGCDEDDSVVEGTGFDIVERNVNFTAAGGNLTVTLSVEGDKVQSDQDWCTASISGKIVTVSLEANPGLEGRTAKVTVSRGTENISFPVTQGGNIVPTAEVENVSFDANGGTKEIQVEHISPFTAVSGAAWLTARVDGSTLILTTQSNYTIDDLETTVKLISGSLESELVVTQTGIVLIPEIRELLMYNTGDETRIGVNSTMPFTAQSDQDWLTVTQGDDFITLSASDNSNKPMRTATVTLTSETLTATIAVTQRAPIYTDYLGSWTLTGTGEESATTYNLTITEGVANSTFKIAGWGKSVVATDSKYALTAIFDEVEGAVYIVAQQYMGAYTDPDNVTHDVMFYGRIEMDGKIYYVTGRGYICYKGMLQPDGSVQWTNGEVTLAGGANYDVIGGMYYIQSRVDGESRSFTIDSPFMRMPTMRKVASSASPRVMGRVNNAETTMMNNLYIQY